MASSLEATQEAIIAFMDAQLPQDLVEQAVPDINTVRRVNGKINPYFAYQFGDIGPGRGKSMAGPRGHDYYLPIRLQAVAPEAGIARRLSNKATMLLTGETFPWAGSITKNRAGGMWPIVNSNNATEAFIFPSGFELLIQLSDNA